MILGALGDSLISGYVEDETFVPDPAQSYPVLVARQIGASNCVLAGESGAFIRMVAGEISRLPVETELLIINAGTNDVFDVGLDRIPVDALIRDFDLLLAGARAHMPRARVIIVGVRDFTQQTEHPDYPLLHDAITAFNAYILALPDTIPVDLARRPGAYDPDLFPDSVAVHPSRNGVAWIAEAVIEAVNNAA